MTDEELLEYLIKNVLWIGFRRSRQEYHLENKQDFIDACLQEEEDLKERQP